MRATIISEVIHAPHLQFKPLLPEQPQQPAVVAQHPSIATKAFRLLLAMRQWQRNGWKRAPVLLRRERQAICKACELYDHKRNFGLGECGAPGCGCTDFKAWILDQTCPHPKGSRWPKIFDSPTV